MKNKSKFPNRRWLPPVLAGVCCAALTGAAAWHDLTRNGGRLVYPMHSYAFRPADIPMLLALVLDLLYALYLALLLVRAVSDRKRRTAETNRARRLNPKLGFLGFLGLLGFAGFWSGGAAGDLTPFCFFVFFGFFGFFYEGKLSGVLMDERYRENAARAEQTAYRAGFSLIFLLLIFAGQGSRFSAGLAAAALTAGTALALGLTLFLSKYLLYRYDCGGAPDMAGEE